VILKLNIIRFSIVVILYLTAIKAISQEQLGVTLGNYSGTAGLLVNPAGMTNNKVFLDINLVTFDFFVRNNFAYLPKEDFVLWDVLKSGYNFPTYGDDDKNVTYYDNSKLKDVTINMRVLGPSAMLQVGDHAFGLTTGIRYFMSGSRIPWDIAELSYNGLNYDPLHNIEFDDYDFDFNTSAWMEVGLSYAYNIYKSYDSHITAGISIKKLWGYSGATIDVKNVNYVVVNDSTINIKNLYGEVGFSLPVDYDNNDFISSGTTFRGSGIGLDIGAVFVKKKKMDMNQWRGGKLCSQKYSEYLYRIGVSILDIGRVKYSTNTQLHSFEDVSQYWVDIDTLGFDNLNTFMEQISNTFYGDPGASLKSNTIKVGLPTALSVQADVNVVKHIYVGGFWIHPIRINSTSLRRPAQLAVVPRYESKYFELSVPISVYEYVYPRIGISARFYFFTIGTERLGTYIGMADMNGLDIYASIKIGINKGSCKSKFGGACSNVNFGKKKSNKRRR
jgi:uncharacterized protein DUF5723